MTNAATRVLVTAAAVGAAVVAVRRWPRWSNTRLIHVKP